MKWNWNWERLITGYTFAKSETAKFFEKALEIALQVWDYLL